MNELDLQYTVVSPESVALEFELASVARRGMAWLIDCLVLGTVYQIVASTGAEESDAVGWISGVQLLAVFVLQWGYFSILEWRLRGQTLGKMALGLRVLRTDGLPIGLDEAIIRNFLRCMDWLPAMYGLGALVAVLNPRCSRLGDLAAGTMVVSQSGRLGSRARELSFVATQQEIESVPSSVLLPADVRRAIDRFAARATRLTPDRAEQIAAPLATALRQRFGWPWPSSSARLLLLLHHTMSGRVRSGHE